MKKIKALGTVVTVLAILIIGCSNPKKETQKEYPLNLIVLLDLSDRVSFEKYGERAKEQVKDDKNNCETIIDVFDGIVKSKGYSNSKSRLQFFIPKQQGFPIDSELKKQLIVFGESPIGNVGKFHELKDSVIKKIDQLYAEVLTTSDANFTGADIWNWFKYEAKRHLDPEFRNYIICVTDGYLEFDKNIQDVRQKGTFITINDYLRKSDDWEKKVKGEFKLIPPEGLDLGQYNPSVKFLMLGIKDRTPEGSLRDRDIIIAYWEPWLVSMNIEPFGFYPSDVKKKEIVDFLENVKE